MHMLPTVSLGIKSNFILNTVVSQYFGKPWAIRPVPDDLAPLLPIKLRVATIGTRSGRVHKIVEMRCLVQEHASPVIPGI
jgi:hypothetical protein